jgi:hypothetical protein
LNLELESIINVAGGMATIITAVVGCVIWLVKQSQKKRMPTFVYEKEGNIYGKLIDGSERQFTHLSLDSNPIFSKSKSRLVFFRSTKKNNSSNSTSFKLVTINLKTLEEVILSDQKPFSDGLMGRYEIMHPRNPLLTFDQSKLLFIIEKYTTGSQLVEVDILTGKWNELFSVEEFDIIRSGLFKGKLLIGASEIGANGRDIFYKICDFKGKVFKKFATYEDYMKFRSHALVKE